MPQDVGMRVENVYVTCPGSVLSFFSMSVTLLRWKASKIMDKLIDLDDFRLWGFE